MTFLAGLPGAARALLLLSALYAGFVLYQTISAGLTLPALLPEPIGWLIWEPLRWGFLAAALTVLGWWRGAGLVGRTCWSAIPLAWIPIAAAALAFGGLNVVSADQALVIAIGALAVSAYEEALFRGLVLRSLLPAGEPAAVIGSALLFGLWHVGEGRPENWLMVVLASGVGLGLAAVRLRSGTIWPCVLWHAAYNLLLHVGTGEALIGRLWLLPDPLILVYLKLAPGLLLGAYGAVVLAGAGRAIGRRA